MTNDVNVRQHLALLAAYSFVFTLVVCPLLSVAIFGPTFGNVPALIVAGLIALVPSVIYWILARAWLYGGAHTWSIHVTYLLLVSWLTFFWFALWYSAVVVPVKLILHWG